MSITLSGPAFKLRSMLAQCTTFQKLVKAASAAAAMAFVYEEAFAGEGSGVFAWVTLGSERADSYAGGTRDHFKYGGSLVLNLEIPKYWPGTVTSQTDTSNFVDSARAGHANDFFNGLQVEMLDGAASGQAREVSDFNGATGAIVLASALPALPGVGSAYRIAPASMADAHLWFKKLERAIRQELAELSGSGAADPLDPDTTMGYLSLKSIRLAQWGEPATDKEDRACFGARIEVEYGL